MADYSKGVIYTIRYCNDSSLIYVGSTIQPLSKRWYNHKLNCFNEKSKGYNYKLYQKIRETNDLQNWYVELYENYPCSSKQELNKREGEVIREIGNLNSNIAGRTKKEWNDENKEHNKEYCKEYYEKNKDIINEYRKEWYEKNKEILKEYYEKNKDVINEKKKEYHQKNKDVINEKHKEYYEKNKDVILEKFICECGGCYTRIHKERHFKTKKHSDYIALLK